MRMVKINRVFRLETALIFLIFGWWEDMLSPNLVNRIFSKQLGILLAKIVDVSFGSWFVNASDRNSYRILLEVGWLFPLNLNKALLLEKGERVALGIQKILILLKKQIYPSYKFMDE